MLSGDGEQKPKCPSLAHFPLFNSQVQSIPKNHSFRVETNFNIIYPTLGGEEIA